MRLRSVQGTATVIFGVVCSIILLWGCADSTGAAGNPELLVKDLERAGLRMGLEYKSGPATKLEVIEQELFEGTGYQIHMKALRGANFAVQLRNGDRLVGVHLFNPRDGKRPHLSVLDPLASSGMPLLNMSADDVVGLYGPPSEIDDGDLTYYYRCTGSALVTVVFVQWSEREPHTYPFAFVRMALNEGDYAVALLMKIEGQVYDWPGEWTRGPPEEGGATSPIERAP